MSRIAKDGATRGGSYKFDNFILDPARGSLSKDGEIIGLRPQAFDVLCHLIDRHGLLVSKAELIDVIWHNTAVSDDSIAQCVAEIRRAIEDVSRTKIRTVPKRGFVFDVPVIERGAAPADQDTDAGIGIGFKRSRGKLAIVALAAAAALVLWKVGDQENSNRRGQDVPGIATPSSIAVLPFADMSQSQDQKYFADGIAEEILNHLAQIQGLSVIARTSSFQFKSDNADIAAIAEKLKVAYILEGSVRKSGDNLRITAQLIDTKSNLHAWSRSYDRTITVGDVIRIQDDIAASVAAAIGTETGLEAGSGRSDSWPQNQEAFDEYLKGLYFQRQIETGGGRDYGSAMSHFRAAIEADPEWAPPYAALGRTMHFYASVMPLTEGTDLYERAKAYIEEAISRDPEYAPAYNSLAFIAHMYDLNFLRAEAMYTKARSLGGATEWGHAILLRSMGKFDEAIEQYRQALIKDPLSTALRVQLAKSLRCAGRYDEAATIYKELVDTGPHLEDLNLVLAYTFLKMGDRTRGNVLFEQYAKPKEYRGAYGPYYALLDRDNDAREALDIVEASEKWRPEDVVITAVLLGDKERALDYLEAAAREAPRSLIFIQCDEVVRSLSGEPRYRRALDTAGIPRIDVL